MASVFRPIEGGRVRYEVRRRYQLTHQSHSHRYLAAS
jgi:hypothetical protein